MSQEIYSIRNQKGEFYTQQFNKVGFTKNRNFAYQFNINEANKVKNWLSLEFPEMTLIVTK